MNSPDVYAVPSQHVFVNQTAAVVYHRPAVKTDVLARLEQGTPLDILPHLPDDETTGTQWLRIRTASGQEGYIRAITKTITREELITERDKIYGGYKMGRGKMGMGGVILLIGAVTVIAPLILSSKHEGTFVMYYGMVAAGAGEFLWGVEQISFVRHALKEFDSRWYQAFPEKFSKPLF